MLLPPGGSPSGAPDAAGSPRCRTASTRRAWRQRVRSGPTRSAKGTVMSSPLQPLRLAAVVGVALLAGAGCAATPEPDPVPAPPVSPSPEASPSAAPGDDEPASDQGLSGGGSSAGGSSGGGSSGGGSSGEGSGGSSWPSPADCLAY